MSEYIFLIYKKGSPTPEYLMCPLTLIYGDCGTSVDI